MQRVLVIGPGGSGKTALARQIAARTGLPLVHLDAHYWRAGWKPTPQAAWDRTVDELVATEAWIMDGNYGRSLPVRLAACDTVVFLDVARAVCLWRLFRRRLQYWGRRRPDLAPGCPERLTWEFVWWVWTYPHRRRPTVMRQLTSVRDDKRVVVLRDGREVERFVASLPTAATGGLARMPHER